MIRLSFVTGSALRKVTISGRKILMASQETGFVPIDFDLDKLEDSKVFNQLTEEQKLLFEEIKNLKTEDEMAEDIIKDFKQTGWKLAKRENGFD